MTTAELRIAIAALRVEIAAHVSIDATLADEDFKLALADKALALVEAVQRRAYPVTCWRASRTLGKCEGT